MLPKDLSGYEPEWIVLAQELAENGKATWSVKNTQLAKTLRFRFYGFRKVFKKFDPENPWSSALMETQVTVDSNGDLHFNRNPYSELMKSFMNAKTFQGIANPPVHPSPQDTLNNPPEELTTSAQYEVLMKLFKVKP